MTHRRYTAEHEWVAAPDPEADPAVVRIGITDVATTALGDIVFVAPPEVGTDLTAGDVCGEVESTKSVSEIYVPLDGTVVAVNESLVDHPEIVNADPFGAGWLFDLRLATGSTSGLDGLLTEQEYRDRTDASAP